MAGFNPKSLLKPRKATGVVAELSSDGTARYAVATLQNGKKGLELESAAADIEDREALEAVVKKGSAINLVATGKGIVVRKIELDDDPSTTAVLEAVLPNARPDDFYVQAYRLEGRAMLAAIARTESVDALVDQLQDMDYLVVNVLLGPFAVLGVESLCGTRDADTLLVGGYRFQLTDAAVTDYLGPDDSVQAVNIDGQAVPIKAVGAFAAGVNYFAPGAVPLIPDLDVVADGASELEQKQLFQLAGWGIMLTLLATLLINFFLFDYYRNALETLDQQVGLNEGNIQSIRILEAEVERKRAFMAQTGILNPSRTSYLADRIAETVPSAVQLTGLFINPLEKKMGKDEEGVSFEADIISINGLSKRSTYLNNWIQTLEKYEWIEEILVVNYTQDSDREAGEFTMEVRLK